jgi:carboxypeptidase Taq
MDLMKWDMFTVMPPTGRAYRAQSSTYMTGKRTELFTSQESRALADYLKGVDASQLDTDLDRAVIRRFAANFDRATAIPADLLLQISDSHFECDAAWLEARRVNDYMVWKPALENYFELKYKAAQIAEPNKHPLEYLMNLYDEDLTVETCGRLLEELKKGVSEVMSKVLPACQDIDESILDEFVNHEEDIDALIHYLCYQFGYTDEMSCYGKILHPWSASLAPYDTRVTTGTIDTGIDNLLTGVHEMGHALYSRGSSPAVIEAGIWGGMKGSAHESQSRFYENIICRSPEFWEYFFPFVQERFPTLRSWNSRAFTQVILKVKPSFIRTRADELTYSLHPVIRFEIERELFEHKLNFAHLSEAWNDKYEELLGIRPTNDLDGCLQDIHWTEDFGKFQSYPMGNIFDGQLFGGIMRDIPDFYAQVNHGQFEDIHKWFADKIHQHGFTYPTMALMERASGEPITTKYYLDYIRNKFYNIYDIKE